MIISTYLEFTFDISRMMQQFHFYMVNNYNTKKNNYLNSW